MCHVWDSSPLGDWAGGEAGAMALVSLPNSGGRLSLVLTVSAVGYFPFQKHWVKLRVALGLAPLTVSLYLLRAFALSSVNVGDGHPYPQLHNPQDVGQAKVQGGPCYVSQCHGRKAVVSHQHYYRVLQGKCLCVCVCMVSYM